MININELHISSEPKLLFMANDINAKGRSNKSYTIKIANTKYNDEVLSQLFSNKAKRVISFDAKYTIESVQMRGRLIINSVEKAYANAIFISGNGKLWEVFENKYLSDYDYADINHTLTLANITETGDIIYDLCDRGAFISDTKVDITERYPALRIKKLFTLLMNAEGYNITWASNLFNIDLDNVYLMYTQNNAIRNSKEWEKSAIATATLSGLVSQSGTGDWTIALTKQLEFTAILDNGSNISGDTYVIPETGTYRFKCMTSTRITKPADATISFHTLTIELRVGATPIYVRTITAGDIVFDATQATVAHTIDTYPTEFTASDVVSIHFSFDGDITIIGGWTVQMIHSSGSNTFENSVSRYYGGNSTIDFAQLLPDMKVLEFIGDVSKYLNLYSYYREELKTLEIEHGRKERIPVLTITPIQVSENLEEVSNFTLEFNTDMAAPLDNIYVDLSGQNESNLRFKFSRTLISDTIRIFGTTTPQIPVLWKEGNPLSWQEAYTPPNWNTKANLRLLEYNGVGSGNYTLTYGGDSSANEQARPTYPLFKELDISSYNRYEMGAEGTQMPITARMDISKLYDQTYFKNPVFVSGHGRFWLLEAEQIKGDIYKLNLIR